MSGAESTHLRQAGDGGRSNAVGFALTVLQRRPASSPEAILRSLERRHRLLELRKQEELQSGPAPDVLAARRLAGMLAMRDEGDLNTDLDDLDATELEALEED